MNDSPNNPLADSTRPKSPGRKPQFSIGKTRLWTAVVAGGLVVVKVSDTNTQVDPFPQAISLSFYIVVVCGILSLLRAPKSFDVWFSTGMNVFIPVLLGLVVLVRELKMLDNGMLDNSLAPFYSLLAIAGIPYGIYLMVLNVRGIKRRDFSIIVYHLGSWFGWIAMWTLVYLSEVGAFL